MLFAELAATSEAVAATRSRLAKRSLLAATIAAADRSELALVITYLSGSLRQRRTGVGWALLTELPTPSDEATLTVTEVDTAFEAIAALAGAGSAAARRDATTSLFGRATAAEQHLLRGLAFGEVRQGALDALVQDGLAAAFEVPVAAVQRAAMLLGSTAAAAEVLADDGPDGLTRITVQVGTPIRPMLAAPAADPAAALDRSGLPALVDAKLDGIRLQVHRDGEVVRLFTRSLDDITERLPEVVAEVRTWPVGSVVADGEVIGRGDDGRPLSFQVISARAATTSDAPGTQLELNVFDLLHVDGRDLLDTPLVERTQVLAETLPGATVVPRTVATTADEVSATFHQAVADGYEGVVVKNLAAGYAAGRRDAAWIKVKPRHTFDLAVTAAEWGSGRRTGKLSNLHLAARGPDGELVMLGKTFKGLTDAMLDWQTEQFQARAVRRTTGTVFVDPPFVAEIAIDGIQRSTRYPGGIALRFARVLRYRQDKDPSEVDTLATIAALG